MEKIFKDTKYKDIVACNDGYIYTKYYGWPYRKKTSKLKDNIDKFTIRIKGNKTYISVARTLATAFIPNPNGYCYVRHKNGDIQDNKLDNLYWSVNNNMDYSAKENYKDYKGTVCGDYIVVEDKGDILNLKCPNCGDAKNIPRGSVTSNNSKCKVCTDYSLDLSSLSSEAFSNWIVVSEVGTQQESDKTKKRLSIKCKCCGQKDTVSYNSYKYRKRKYKCSIEDTLYKKAKRTISSMKNRCYSKNSRDYHRYGGRGIRICSQWLNDFDKFVSWSFDNGIDEDLTIERIDNDGNYEPSNCKWASRAEQNRNQSTTLLTHEIVKKIRGTNWPEDMSYRDIAEELGLDRKKRRYGYFPCNER